MIFDPIDFSTKPGGIQSDSEVSQNGDVAMSEELNELEKAAFEHALKGDASWLELLRSQVPHMRVKQRTYTSAGGYTYFVFESSVASASIPENDSNYPPVVLIRHQKLVHGGAFIVWTKDGRIASLEANVDGDGAWPLGREKHLAEFSFIKPL